MQESGPGSGCRVAAQPMRNVASATIMSTRRKVPTPLIFITEKTKNLSHRTDADIATSRAKQTELPQTEFARTSVPRKQPIEADGGDFTTKHREAAPERSRATTAQEVDGNFTSTSQSRQPKNCANDELQLRNVNSFMHVETKLCRCTPKGRNVPSKAAQFALCIPVSVARQRAVTLKDATMYSLSYQKALKAETFLEVISQKNPHSRTSQATQHKQVAAVYS